MKEFPEANIQNLADQLKGVKASNKSRSEENCTNCGQQGHSEHNCWGIWPACGELGHSPGTCQLSPEQIRARENENEEEKDKLITRD